MGLGWCYGFVCNEFTGEQIDWDTIRRVELYTKRETVLIVCRVCELWIGRVAGARGGNLCLRQYAWGRGIVALRFNHVRATVSRYRQCERLARQLH